MAFSLSSLTFFLSSGSIPSLRYRRTRVIQLSSVVVQLMVCIYLIWILGECRVSIGMNLSWSVSFDEVSRARASASACYDLGVWQIVYELSDPSNFLALRR